MHGVLGVILPLLSIPSTPEHDVVTSISSISGAGATSGLSSIFLPHLTKNPSFNLNI